jgi:hypothetical protein
MTDNEAVAAVESGGRATTDQSLHAAEVLGRCERGAHWWRTIACDGIADRDVIECATCGKQVTTRCIFDGEYS